MEACVCPNLKVVIERPHPFYSYDNGSQQLSLRLSDNALIRNAKCIFCGGQRLGVQTGLDIANPRMCACGTVEGWVANEEPHVARDGNGAFSFKFRSKDATTAFPIYFCPACGGRMNDGHKAGQHTPVKKLRISFTPSERDLVLDLKAQSEITDFLQNRPLDRGAYSLTCSGEVLAGFLRMLEDSAIHAPSDQLRKEIQALSLRLAPFLE